jgi:biotin transport system substrate-specific component
MIPTRKLVTSSFFAAIIALLAQISIPLFISPVPITGQTFGIFLAGAILGGKWGMVSVMIYILLGVVGVPVFSFFQGGMHIIVGRTGGYLMGFIPGCYLLGKMTEKKPVYGAMVLGMFICMIIYLTTGTLYLAYLLQVSLYQAFLMGALPFLPLDIAKILAAASLGVTLRQRLEKGGYL